jgi:Fe-S cluster biogenesis protein NfuA
MFIQTETTPNPLTLKFMPGLSVGGSRSVEYTAPEQAITSPLAQELFKVQGVVSVFLGNDFITITKEDKGDWDILKPQILGAIMDHFVAGKPVFYGEEKKSAPQNENADPIVAEILELIETKIRPAVAQDGGDVVFDRFEEGIVYLQMRGSCAGCPSASATLKGGIENMLKYYIPEIIEVRSV